MLHNLLQSALNYLYAPSSLMKSTDSLFCFPSSKRPNMLKMQLMLLLTEVDWILVSLLIHGWEL